MAFIFVAIFGPETYYLITNWRGTLSNWWWTLLNAQRGVPILDWTAIHFLLCGVFAVLTLWLWLHIFFHILT
jgi:hypothetical protein